MKYYEEMFLFLFEIKYSEKKKKKKKKKKVFKSISEVLKKIVCLLERKIFWGNIGD